MRTSPARLTALSSIALAVACASTPPPTQPKQPAFDASTAESSVARELDDFHDAAAHADETRYFAHFARAGVFLGTDATERWDVPAFRAYAHPHFSVGKGWVFHVVRRVVTFSRDGNTAWFDEQLRGDKLGATRGSGVLTRENGRYLIAQYNLSFTIPNERFDAVHALLDAPPAPPDLRVRYKIAYDEATKAAAAGDFVKARDLLSALVPESKTHPDDDLEFWLHNELTWIRWAEQDMTGALAEVDAAKATLDHSTLPADKTRALRLHEKWDRAYLTLSPLAHADYMALAKLAGDADGMAVLDAYFATRRHDGRAARIAAHGADIAKDSDLQDLYVIAGALDAGGDHENAAKVRVRICGGRDYLMKPIIVRELAKEGHPCP